MHVEMTQITLSWTFGSTYGQYPWVKNDTKVIFSNKSATMFYTTWTQYLCYFRHYKTSELEVNVIILHEIILQNILVSLQARKD